MKHCFGPGPPRAALGGTVCLAHRAGEATGRAEWIRSGEGEVGRGDKSRPSGTLPPDTREPTFSLVSTRRDYNS